ncbi:MAG: VOC family protein [Planctomycetaceae bacterium]|nr:VOC family protein [Planctomycetaceae bacterium]
MSDSKPNDVTSPSEATAIQIVQIKYMLMAADMPRAVRFFEVVFGLTRRFVSDHWSELTWGDAVVALHGGHSGKDHPTGLSIQVEDAAAACERIARSGGRIVSGPRQRPGEPIRLADVADAEGNLFFVTEFVG